MPNFFATSSVCAGLPPAIESTSIPSMLRTASRCLTPKAPCPANTIFIFKPDAVFVFRRRRRASGRRATSVPLAFVLENDVPDRRIGARHVVKAINLADVIVERTAHDQPHDHLDALRA